jgi:polysaccharide export outer membrane protein
MKLLMPFVAALCLWGCASNSAINTQPPALTEATTQYKMGVGDKLSIQVWKSPELSVDIPVRPDGMISVPLVGDVKAAGVTAQDLSRSLTTELGKFVRNPQVTVIVIDPASADYLRRVRVTGAVEQPLSITYHQGMTVLDLVLQAGGGTEFASLNQAKLYRKYGDKIEVFPVYLDDILLKGKLETNYMLSPSDIIAVPERLF